MYPAPSAGPPPPPPPAVQPPEQSAGSKADGTEAARANLFASINKGGQVTQGTAVVSAYLVKWNRFCVAAIRATKSDR